MDWIFKHLQIIIALAGGVAWLLKQRNAAAGDEAKDAAPRSEEKSFEDPELAERTRRIREEIQRKIAQRTRANAGGTVGSARAEPTPPPLGRPAAVATSESESGRRAEAARTAEVLAQQQTLLDRLQEAKRLKASAGKRAEFEATTVDGTAAMQAATRSTVLEDLQTPDALRRAFILREVLGPPVALRG